MSQLNNTAVSFKTTWFERVPKVELHIHLEGAIPHEALWQLVQKYGGDPSVPTLESLQKKFEYRDFIHFVDAWLWKNQFLRFFKALSHLGFQRIKNNSSLPHFVMMQLG